MHISERTTIARMKTWSFLFLVLWASTATAQHDSTGLWQAQPFDHLQLWLINADDNFSHPYLTLEQALEEGRAIIHNENSQTLWIENRSDTDLFVEAGDLIKGGQQDRMIADDRILPRQDSAHDLNVYCIESGRSTQRGSEPLATFSASHWMAPMAHTRLVIRHDLTEQLLTPQMGGLTAPDSSELELLNSLGNLPQPILYPSAAQEAVWNDVVTVQSALTKHLKDSVTKNASPTSLELSLESSAVADREHSFQHHFEALAKDHPHSVGIAYAIDGKLVGAEIYGTHALFAAMWLKLLRSISAAVIASPELPHNTNTVSEQQVEEFLNAQGTVTAQQIINARTRVEAAKTSFATRFTTWDTGFSQGPLHTEWIAN